METTRKKSVFGFALHPSQSLSQEKGEGLHREMISLLSSLTYHPEHVVKTSLDLRYVVTNDASPARKRFAVVLLISLTFDTAKPPQAADRITQKFQEQFYNLLSLHLVPYEIRIEPLSETAVSDNQRPFMVAEVVEITRRITQHKPFSLSSFRGNSNMSKIVDMMLRESGQYVLSVLVEPHQLTQTEVDSVEVFGFKTGLLQTSLARELL